MSLKNGTTRLYSISDADLKQKADHVVKLVTRDLTAFRTTNVTEHTINAFRALITDFDNLISNHKPQGAVMDVLREKNRIADQVRKLLCKLENIESLHYEVRSKFSGFEFDDLSNMSDKELCRLAKRVVSAAETLRNKLPGQTLLKDIGTLAIAAISLDVSIDAQHEAIDLRDHATEAKVKQGNMLWIEVVRLCLIGKSLYENESKYNDYVLTESLNFYKKDATAAS